MYPNKYQIAVPHKAVYSSLPHEGIQFMRINIADIVRIINFYFHGIPFCFYHINLNTYHNCIMRHLSK